MKAHLTLLAALSLAAASLVSLVAKDNPTVGDAVMDPSKTIVENAMNSKDHTTLVAALKATGLAETLSGPGPFTVFAPTNEAFTVLPSGTMETLLKPANKEKLIGILTYHVVAGKVTAEELIAKIKKGDGKTTLKTVNGEKLTATSPMIGAIVLADSKGNKASVTIANVYQSNGVIHVIDTVLMP